MISTLITFQVILSIAIIITVLLQKSSSIGLGAYSGSNESLFGAKGPASFLAKATFVLAILFIINTLAMGYIYNSQKDKSVADKIEKIQPNLAVPKPVDTKDTNKDTNSNSAN